MLQRKQQHRLNVRRRRRKEVQKQVQIVLCVGQRPRWNKLQCRAAYQPASDIDRVRASCHSIFHDRLFSYQLNRPP